MNIKYIVLIFCCTYTNEYKIHMCTFQKKLTEIQLTKYLQKYVLNANREKNSIHEVCTWKITDVYTVMVS